MKSRIVLAVLPFLLAACGDGAGNSSAPAAPVAAVTAPAGQSWLDTVAQTEGGFRVGNPDAPVKLIEYGARSCPTCGAFAREGAEPLLNNYVASGKVSFEFRDFLVHGALGHSGRAARRMRRGGAVLPVDGSRCTTIRMRTSTSCRR